MEASCHERAAGKDRGPILFHADDGPANGGGFIEYLVELPDREFAIVGIFTLRIGVVHDIGGMLELFGGIAIVVIVSLPSVALSTLSASWPNDISRGCLSFLVPQRVRENRR